MARSGHSGRHDRTRPPGQPGDRTSRGEPKLTLGGGSGVGGRTRLASGAFVAGACVAGLVGGCLPASPAAGQQPVIVVLNGENNRLDAYDAETGAKHTVIASATDDPVAGLDINAEICIVPEGTPWKPAGE